MIVNLRHGNTPSAIEILLRLPTIDCRLMTWLHRDSCSALIGFRSVLNFHTQITTNQWQYEDLCRSVHLHDQMCLERAKRTVYENCSSSFGSDMTAAYPWFVYSPKVKKAFCRSPSISSSIDSAISFLVNCKILGRNVQIRWSLDKFC